MMPSQSIDESFASALISLHRAALANMAGPIPKVGFTTTSHTSPQLILYFQDSYALITFAAVCVAATAFVALSYLPAITLFFAHASAETQL